MDADYYKLREELREKFLRMQRGFPSHTGRATLRWCLRQLDIISGKIEKEGRE